LRRAVTEPLGAFFKPPLEVGVGDYEQTKYMLKQKIKKLFANDYSGHDYWHSIRVLNTAEKISKQKNATNT